MPQICDLKIVNGAILTIDNQNSIIDTGYICITGDAISHIGHGDHDGWHAARAIDAGGGLIMPGLVNGHTHAAMTLFRGLADDLPLMDWLNHYIFPAESQMDADFVYTGSLLACAEMILGGTTTFCDMYLFENEVARAAHEAGMRCVVGEVLYDFPSPNYGPPDKGLAYTQRLIDAWRDDPLVSIAVEPHSLYTCSPELLKQADQLARSNQVPLILHVAETLAEIDQIRQVYGKLPVAHMEALGILGAHVIADHCIHVTPAEIDRMAHFDVKVVINPESNMKLASGAAPLTLLQQRGLTIGLGTDGCASNNNLDMFAEMDSAAKLHKLHTMDPTAMNARACIRCATIDCARALGLDHLIGSLEIGKKADIIIVDTQQPHLTPLYSPYSQLVYAASGADVSHSIVNGRVLMENRQLTTLNVRQIMDRANQKAGQVRQWIAAAALKK